MSDTPKTDELADWAGRSLNCVSHKDWIELSSALETENATLRARIEELTEWRPMETAPLDQMTLILCDNGCMDCAIYAQGMWMNQDEGGYDPIGWLPLPQPEEGERHE